METRQIRALLQRFYDGNTTPEEEKRLFLYFSGKAVEKEFDADREIFMSMNLIKDEEIEIPDDLESSVMETLSKVQEVKKPGRTRILYAISSAAAVILILVSSLILINRNDNLGTFKDPQLAYAETREALDLVSHYFNMGTNKLKTLEKYSEAVQPLNNLSKFSSSTQELNLLSMFDKGIEKSSGILSTIKK